jgi:hypothetical protein
MPRLPDGHSWRILVRQPRPLRELFRIPNIDGPWKELILDTCYDTKADANRDASIQRRRLKAQRKAKGLTYFGCSVDVIAFPDCGGC